MGEGRGQLSLVRGGKSGWLAGSGWVAGKGMNDGAALPLNHLSIGPATRYRKAVRVHMQGGRLREAGRQG
ncbi:hypothetical protein E2C01_050187 [Portunus trituberculatus]|uniref:Uncharacterized protein n=1 Tax=Portunus trituberculatus TaxID=210409 RepID=A0A5B7GI83_PORTR|nr:hypothetical protein [Portunus trituberculatus]